MPALAAPETATPRLSMIQKAFHEDRWLDAAWPSLGRCCTLLRHGDGDVGFPGLGLGDFR